MSYPHKPYGYEPGQCPVVGLVPMRRYRYGPDDRSCEGQADHKPSETDKFDQLLQVLLRRAGLPGGVISLSDSADLSDQHIEQLVDYVAATGHGWRFGRTLRLFLRWWRSDVVSTPVAQAKRRSDALVMLGAMIHGKDRFVRDYLADLHDQEPSVKAPRHWLSQPIFAAMLALILSPVILMIGIYVFIGLDHLISIGQGRLFGYSYDLLFYVGSFGAIGALVSMMMRLGRNDDWASATAGSAFLSFLFRPCLGFCFALLALLLLSAGILPISLDRLHGLADMDDVTTIQGSGQMAVVLIAAFLSGFSERLGPALINRVERRVGDEGRGL
ncbi:MAG: hypothetical protein ABID63_01700 [Pseudomonadota bacterium]